MSEVLLPLFPLQVVLFPTSILPLHIFEERYKTLVNECLREDRPFGITLVHEQEVATVGCTAAIVKLAKKYDDGRMDILVQGKHRFMLQQIVDTSSPYVIGKVELLKSEDEGIDSSLAKETVELHNQLVAMVYRSEDYLLDYDIANTMFSFKIAQKAGMELPERQKLLEAKSENERLHLLHAYFTEVIPKLEHLSEIERVVKSDGYIIHQ